MDRLSYLAVLFGILLISTGCIDTSNLLGGTNENETKTTGLQGLAVDKFGAEITDIYPDQSVYLTMQLKNKGEMEARDTQAKLYNIRFGGCPTCWTIQDVDPSCNYGSVTWSCPGDLKAGEKSVDLPAVPRQLRWNLRSPRDIPPHTTIPYEFMSRIYYRYKTIASTQLQVMSAKQYRKEEIATRKSPKVDNSDGPLRIRVRTKQPVVVHEDNTKVNFCVLVENVGSGTPFSKDVSYRNIRLEDEGIVDLEFDFSGLNRKTREQIKLVSDKQVQCEQISVGSVDIKQDVKVTIEASYGYYQDTTTSVSVGSQ